MSMELLFLDTSPSHDPVSISSLMKMPPGTYAGKTIDGDDAAILIRKSNPIVEIKVIRTERIILAYEFYSDGTINSYPYHIDL